MKYDDWNNKVGAKVSLIFLRDSFDNIPCYLEDAALKAYTLGIKENHDFVKVEDIGTIAYNPWGIKSAAEINTAVSKAFSKYVTGRGFVATRSSEDDAFIVDVRATQEQHKDDKYFQSSFESCLKEISLHPLYVR